MCEAAVAVSPIIGNSGERPLNRARQTQADPVSRCRCDLLSSPLSRRRTASKRSSTRTTRALLSKQTRAVKEDATGENHLCQSNDLMAAHDLGLRNGILSCPPHDVLALSSATLYPPHPTSTVATSGNLGANQRRLWSSE